MALPLRKFGETGLQVPVLGLGTAELGGTFGEKVSEEEASRVLNTALDCGVTLIDTARMYGSAEERIGRHIAHRRSEFVLSSKCGYSIPGTKNWSEEAVGKGVDEALKLMCTDHIDIMHLHSCPRDVLERGEVVAALEAAVKAGKVVVAAYSGENEALEYAISCGRFDAIQVSVSVCDQRALREHIPVAESVGLGVIAKRPLANAPWRHNERPVGSYGEVYWDRFQKMNLDSHGYPWDELALRFAVYSPGVHTVITGTTSPEHLKWNAQLASMGPLPENVIADIRATFEKNDDNWIGQI